MFNQHVTNRMDFERLRELDYVGFAPYMGIYEQQPGIENHHKSLTKGIYTLMGNMMIDHWISGQTHVAVISQISFVTRYTVHHCTVVSPGLWIDVATEIWQWMRRRLELPYLALTRTGGRWVAGSGRESYALCDGKGPGWSAPGGWS